jgi:hypothetical protein
LVQLPGAIWGSAAKHLAPAKKQNARVNPIGFIFMCSIESGLLIFRQYFFKLTAGK